MSRLVGVASCVLVAGCQLVFPLDGPARDGGTGNDADVDRDAAVDVPDSCIVTALATVCPRDPVPPPVTVSTSIQIDTGSSTMCAPLTSSIPDTCAIIADTIDIQMTAKLRVVGPRPLVVIGLASMSMAGEIDISGTQAQAGAGARDAATCNPPAPGVQGGGGGGSFVATGGRGGGVVNGGGGAPTPVITADRTLRGGCAGSDGGAPNAGQGGQPGGAVALMTRNTMAISGRIDASGGGGGGGLFVDSGGGGGGGGAGGLIVLEATTFAISGAVFANGGGGGAGGATTSAGPSGGDPASFDVPGLGGVNADGTAGRGGNGGVRTTPATAGTTAQDTCCGGGGGGGSVGVIYMIPVPATVPAAMSPAPVAPPPP
ncbi:MAG TPA: hypothetical protein VFQ53_05455 [Kofleriaceae bacterium]|nr:hypothetical protein [Kofleriaceae bacterium]